MFMEKKGKKNVKFEFAMKYLILEIISTTKKYMKLKKKGKCSNI